MPNRMLEYATAFPFSICTLFGIEAASTRATGVVTAVAGTAEARAVEALEAVPSQLPPAPHSAEPATATASLAFSALAALEPSSVVAGAPGE